jgi:uncharacterized protein (TIGR03089 family)
VTPLAGWTRGLAGERDPAQPLLTLLDGPARVELSGATTANWVAKSANLLVDGLGAPQRVGLLLPLHWQTVVLVLAGVATGATVVVAADVGGLSGCDVAFTTAQAAGDALDASGADEVLALSGHPLGAPCPSLPPLVLDYAREVPSYGDGWHTRPATPWSVEVAGAPLGELRTYGLGAGDRVVVTGSPAVPGVLAGLLGVLQAGAAVLLAPDPASLDLARLAGQEQATAGLGVAVAGLRTLD